MSFAHFVSFYFPKYWFRRRSIVVSEITWFLAEKIFFLKKVDFLTKNGRHRPFFKATQRHEYVSVEHLQGIKTCLRTFQSPKKVILRQCRTSGSHFTTFEIRPKNRYFGDLGPQNRLKNGDSAPFKRKKRCNSAFQALENFFSEKFS